MTLVGGLRTRFIRDSLEAMVRTTLQDRGWLGTGRRHLPITFIPEPPSWETPIELNSIAVSPSDVDDEELELGSVATNDSWTYYVDFYAENEALGMDVSGDVRDSLRGKMPSIGRGRPVLPVYDLTLATPTILFYCDIVDVVWDRGRGFTQPWRQFWFTVRCTIEDTYYDDGTPGEVEEYGGY